MSDHHAGVRAVMQAVLAKRTTNGNTTVNNNHNNTMSDDDSDSSSSNSNSNSNSSIMMMREQVVEEFLEACGADQEKRALVMELAETVMGGDAEKTLKDDGTAVAEDETAVTLQNDDDDDDDDDDDNNNSTDEEENDKEYDESRYTDIESMDKIRKSPYEELENAEVGEDSFDEFKALLEPGVQNAELSGMRRSRHVRPIPKAIEIFGPELAQTMVLAYHHIALSGMVYSPDWMEGLIRDVHCGEIPKPMLLLCLQEQRFARSDFAVLSKVCLQLQLKTIILEALNEWGMEEAFPMLANSQEQCYTYLVRYRLQCRRCEIFVARAYSCMNTLQDGQTQQQQQPHNPEEDLAKKMFSCLKIMHTHLITPETGPDSSQISRKQREVNSGPHSSSQPSRKQREVNTIVERGVPATEKISIPGYGDKLHRPLEKLDMETGKVLDRYDSFSAALAAQGGLAQGNGIYHVLAGRCKSSGGFFWRYAGSLAKPRRVKRITIFGKKKKKDDSNDDLVGTKNDNPDDELADDDSHSPQKTKPFRIPVQKVCIKTGNILATYESVRAAHRAEGDDCKGIYECLRGHISSYHGYVWRRPRPDTLRKKSDQKKKATTTTPSQGVQTRAEKVDVMPVEVLKVDDTPRKASKVTPAEKVDVTAVGVLKVDDTPRKGSKLTPVEKVDMAGEVVEVYDNPGKASKAEGSGIYHCLNRGHARHKGFLYRYVGSQTQQPAPSEGYKPIEQLCPKTGRVVAEYKNAAEAKRSIGVSIECSGVYKVLKGHRAKYQDYFWRIKGSGDLPWSFRKEANAPYHPIEQLCLKTGRVIAEFRTPVEAMNHLCIATKHAGMYRVLRGKDKSFAGFFWRSKGASRPVEKVSLSSGVVLARYDSCLEAQHKVKRDSGSGVQLVCEGKLDSYMSCFWRYVGSSMPKGLEKKRAWKTVEALAPFDGSAYSRQDSFEADEALFQRLKKLLEPSATAVGRGIYPSIDALNVFGKDLAGQMVLTHHHVKLAGIAFSSNWLEGTIRDVKCGSLPESMLLLCLAEHRLMGGNYAALDAILNELEVVKLVCKALEDWGLSESYPLLSSDHNALNSGRIEDRFEAVQCQIFVARVYLGMLSLKDDLPEDSLVAKVKACLGVIETRIEETIRGSKRKIYLEVAPDERRKQARHEKPPVVDPDDRRSQAGHERPSQKADQSLDVEASKYAGNAGRMPGDTVGKAPVPKTRPATEVHQDRKESRDKREVETIRGSKRKIYLEVAPDERRKQARHEKSPVVDPDDRRSQAAHERPSQKADQSLDVEASKYAGNAGRMPGDTVGKASVPETRPATEVHQDRKESRDKREVTDAESHGVQSEESHGTLEDSGPESSSPILGSTAPIMETLDEGAPLPIIGKAGWKQISALNEITESPYEENHSAEVGERMFDIFKSLLVPKEGVGRRRPDISEEATKAFGAALAKSLVLASSRIAVSGMVYGSEWRDGIIRGMQCGFIPKPMLLLCLQEQRFARVGDSDGVLVRIVNDLGLCLIVKDAIKEWDLLQNYPHLASFTSHGTFVSRKVQCLQCVIFIARAYRCMKALKWKSIDDSVMGKVRACLGIMNMNSQTRIGTVARHPSKKVEPKLFNRPAYQSANYDDSSTSSSDSSDDGSEAPRVLTKRSHQLFQDSSDEELSVPGQNPASIRPTHKLLGQASRSNSASTSAPEKSGNNPKPASFLTDVYTTKPSVVGQSISRAPAMLKKSTDIISPGSAKMDEGDIDSSWYPHDPREVILNPIESEMAWLAEESVYCLRNREIQWNFVWKYASPTLKVELRKISNEDGNQLDQLVRVRDGLVSRRFAVVRQDIRRKLHRGFLRTRMRNVIPKLRLASRPMLGASKKANGNA